jgi:predicted glycogen debranching enzyme
MKIEFTAEQFRDVAAAARREWLETNGTGGFASSSILGLNTRRYHGLLTAALAPPQGRVVFLARIEETVRVGDAAFELGVNQYPGALHPRGDQLLQSFRLDPFPTSSYALGGARLERQVAMTQGRNAVIVSYTLTGAPAAAIELYPLLACRDYHQLQHENPYVRGDADKGDGWVRFALYDGLPAVYLCASSFSYRPTGHWYRGFEYAREQERGLDSVEDLFNPGGLTLSLREGEPLHVIAALEPVDARSAESWLRAETRRRETVVAPFKGDPVGMALARATDAFLIRRPDGHASVIAGYPWFTDWGRDTMIALPGLTVPTRRLDEARAILATFAYNASEGMIPNRFPDGGETPDYNTVDATLWLFVAAWHLWEATGDRDFIQTTMLPLFEEVIAWHQRGTRYGIRVDADGLLAAGEPGTQLTWMDAKVGDWVVTPRAGKAVEINALWYNALRIAATLAGSGRDGQSEAWLAAAARARDAFVRRFWSENRGYLADVVDTPQGTDDFSLRPNQLFALSLPFPLIEGDRARRVLATVEAHLLTPYGLRSLSPEDPSYRPRYEGDPYHRDSAYHQGTVWPWPIGAYWEAKLRVEGGSTAVKSAIRAQMRPLIEHLADAGLGSISEIFDADPPHRPAGCIAQAWSVSEVLRIWEKVRSERG